MTDTQGIDPRVTDIERRSWHGSVPGAVAVVLVLVEWLASGAFGGQPVLAALVLVVAPGLAVLPFLPDELRCLPVAAPVVPIAGVALSIILLVSLSSADVSLTGSHIRIALLAGTLAALAGSAAAPVAPHLPRAPNALSNLAALLLLAAVTCVGIALQATILGGKPLPGEDWGEYLLYVEQIARHHTLLLDNPYWMLGGHPFPQDPGAPSIYGAYLALTGHGAAGLVQGIWLFAVLGILAVYVFVTALAGPVSGTVAAAVYAVTPMNLDILSWHGLANVDALTVLPLALLATAFVLRGEGSRRWAAVLAVSLVALAAAHRFSFVLGVGAIAMPLAYALLRRCRATPAFLRWASLFLVVTGTGVAVDLYRRNTVLHGTQSYRAFLPTKLNWDLLTRDLTWTLVATGLVAIAIVLATQRHRKDSDHVVLIGLLLAILALTYAWVAHVPTGYNRAAYFFPLLLAATIGLAAARLATPLVLPVVAVVAVAAVTGVRAHALARDYRSFYGHTNAASLAGLGYVGQTAKPRDAVVTDQCWSFLATWLLHRPTLAALDPSLILPSGEVAPATIARRILYGNPTVGRKLARRRHIRFALVDPQCTYQTGSPYGTPRIGTLVYASTRLLVLEIRN